MVSDGKAEMTRYDLVLSAHGIDVIPHFCREFDEHGEGCFGFNPLHGMTWADACNEAADLFTKQAEHWRQRAIDGPDDGDDPREPSR